MKIETLASDLGDDIKIVKQEGGMINDNYIVESTSDNKVYFLTVYSSRKDWWKVKKNIRVGNLLESAGVPVPKAIRYGVYDGEEGSTAYLMREYITGETYDSLMKDGVSLGETDWIKLLSDFGDNLAKIHSIRLDNFGMIKGCNITSSPLSRITHSVDWVSFVDQLLEEREGRLSNIFPQMKIGGVNGLDIHKLFSNIKRYYVDHRGSLFSVAEPALTHNDLVFTNLIASKTDDEETRWNLSGILDTDWALAGDPDYDLIQIENWARLAPYSYEFSTYFGSFIDSYRQRRPILSNLEDKRGIYHIARSISYLTSVFDYDYEEFAASPLHRRQVEKHYGFLRNIVSNNDDFKLFV